MGARIVGAIMVFGGALFILFHRRIARFNSETDARVMPGTRNSLPGGSPVSVLLTGVGAVIFGLYLLLR